MSQAATEPPALPAIPEAPAIRPEFTGPAAIARALGAIDLDKLEHEHREVIRTKKVSKRPRAVQVLNVIEGLRRNNLKPSDLLIKSVPVIPPAFRPFSVVGNTFVPGDANELYRDLIQLRDAHHTAEGLLGHAGSADSRLALYDSIKALYGYGDPVLTKTKQRGVSGFLRQISGTSPKFSWVQRKLLSKPQDSVSRGTIAVDPELGIDEIGVPRATAWTKYASYLQRRLVMSGMSQAQALEHIANRTPYATKALEQEVRVRPVIYSRAPSWHKFNTLAGHPKLIDGNTITINPLVTTGLNADFDGDAINLHVPSHPDSVAEAYDKLLPSKMLVSIRNQDDVMPKLKHEQLLGAYAAVKRPAKQKHIFRTHQQALDAIRNGHISLSDDVEIR